MTITWYLKAKQNIQKPQQADYTHLKINKNICGKILMPKYLKIQEYTQNSRLTAAGVPAPRENEPLAMFERTADNNKKLHFMRIFAVARDC